jgi:predicted CXXCH cytochrome family protein
MKQLLPVTAGCLLLWALAAPQPARAVSSSIVGSPHDLSAQSPSRIRAASENRICIFCHTPHHATMSTNPETDLPLWSRTENAAFDYTPYRSNAIAASPGQPQGASRLCLSCHDGTIALGSYGYPALDRPGGFVRETFGGNRLSDYSVQPGKKTAVIGKDLSDDHPISMEYGLKPLEFVDPDPLLTRLLSLRNGKLYVECTACHSPHDNEYGNFLVKDTSVQKDAICTMCHNKYGWGQSAHKTDTALAATGCVSCHTPHGANQGLDLLVFSSDTPAPGIAPVDTNCVTSTCHTGQNGKTDMSARFNPAGRYVHPLTWDNPTNTHLDVETLPLPVGPGPGNPNSSSKHVHCMDCHNPHRANSTNSPLALANAPAVNGALQGIRGVDENAMVIDNGTGAPNEYQICFKCHSGPDAAAGSFNGSAGSGGPYVQRFFSSLAENERFRSSAWSAHPVINTSTGNRGNLVAGYGSAQYIYCSSCHDPHGSSQPHLLKGANRDAFDHTVYSASQYQLCFSCHDEAWLFGTAPSAKLHKAHVQGSHISGQPSGSNSADYNPSYYNWQASCSVCHDPHGVPNTSGGSPAVQSTATNAAHLVNFQQRYVPYTAAYDSSARTCFQSGTGGDGTTTCHAGPAALYQGSYTSYPSPNGWSP